MNMLKQILSQDLLDFFVFEVYVMNHNNKHTANFIRKYFVLILLLQFIGASTLAYSHVADGECCHTKKGEDSCCMMDDMSPSHCPMENDAALGLSHCGCQHDKDTIDQFIVNERTVITDIVNADIPQFDINTLENNYESFSCEFKFLPSEIPKYITNASFLI